MPQQWWMDEGNRNKIDPPRPRLNPDLQSEAAFKMLHSPVSTTGCSGVWGTPHHMGPKCLHGNRAARCGTQAERKALSTAAISAPLGLCLSAQQQDHMTPTACNCVGQGWAAMGRAQEGSL